MDVAEPHYIQGSYTAVKWSSDNRTLATTWVVEDRDFLPYLRITTFAPVSDQLVSLIEPLKGSLVLHMLWDENSASIFMSGMRRISRYWLNSARIEQLIELPRKVLIGLAYNAQQQLLAVHLSNHVGVPNDEQPHGLVLFNLENMATPRPLNLEIEGKDVHPYSAEQIKWSPDGRYFAAADPRKMVVGVWDAANWESLYQHGVTSQIDSIHWLPDSRRLLVSETNRTISCIDVVTGEILSANILNSSTDVHVIHRNGVDYVVCRAGQEVWFANAENPATKQSMTLPVRPQKMSVSNDGSRLAYVTHFERYEEILPPVILDIDPAMYL